MATLCEAARPILAALLLAAGLCGCTLVPHPISDADRVAEIERDRQEMFGDQEPLRHPLTLHEAFARALKYNLDGRVKLWEEALTRNDLDLSRYDLLPKAYVNAAYTSRTNVDASSSRSVLTGQQSLEPSTSQDINQRTADLLVSWNVLDFGVSYLGARQQTDRVLIGGEERRKVIQTLYQDIRRAFWRAASAQRLSRQITAAIGAAEGALPSARKVETEGLRSPVDSLRYQKALLELIRQLEGIQQQLAISKTELAQLINLPPGTSYALAVPDDRSLRIQSLPMPMRQMEETALLLNPDIRELSYQKRISVDETHRALLKLLPGVNFVYDPNVDSNSFLVNHVWATGAARLGGYVSNLLQAPVVYARSVNAEHLADLKREAMSMAVLAKLHIAYQEYLASSKEYRRARERADVDQRLYAQISNRTVTDVGGDLERISAQVSAVTAQLTRYQAYAETQAALGRIYDTLGVDPAPEDIDMLDITGLTRALRGTIAEREDGTTAPASASAAPSVTSRVGDASYPPALTSAPPAPDLVPLRGQPQPVRASAAAQEGDGMYPPALAPAPPTPAPTPDPASVTSKPQPVRTSAAAQGGDGMYPPALTPAPVRSKPQPVRTSAAAQGGDGMYPPALTPAPPTAGPTLDPAPVRSKPKPVRTSAAVQGGDGLYPPALTSGPPAPDPAPLRRKPQPVRTSAAVAVAQDQSGPAR
jgi:outer membrane protein, multidrug efflux system